MENLGRILKYFRTFGHRTQNDLAWELKISRSYISEIEKGEKLPSFEILQKYAEFFDIPISAIILFSEELEDKKLLRKKAKEILRGTCGERWLKWICQDKTIGGNHAR